MRSFPEPDTRDLTQLGRGDRTTLLLLLGDRTTLLLLLGDRTTLLLLLMFYPFLFFRQEAYKCILEALDQLHQASTVTYGISTVPSKPGPPTRPDPDDLTVDQAKKLVRILFLF